MKWHIDNVEISNPIVLAPMAGISNPAYMKICEEMGVGYAVTELISAEAVVRNNKKTFDMLKGIDNLNIPIAIQIFGSNPETMAKAALILTNLYSVKIIDINMGCPVPKVALKSNAGSALLKDLDRIYDIVATVCQNVEVPVTVKIRSGWDFEHINALEVAKTVEKAGASAIAIHARTRSQGYSGQADWQVIKQVKESVGIPVIGNGDIKSCYDAKRMLEETGCDAVMIGRAALGNPWIIKECLDFINDGVEPSIVTKEEKCLMMLKHLNLLLQQKSERLAVLEMRSHIAWYVKGLANTTSFKQEVFKINDKENLKQLIINWKNT